MVKATPTASGIPVYCAYRKIVSIASLKPHPQNPNTHPQSQIELLSHLLQTHGWRAPITVSQRSGLIVRGHGRRLAALHLGLKQAPVDVQEYASEAAELADVIADNRASELCEWDPALLQEAFTVLAAQGIDGWDAGFDEQALKSLQEEGIFSGDEQASQGRLDQQTSIICPQCGHEFAR